MHSTATVNWSSKKLKSLSEEFITEPENVRHLDVSNNLLKSGRSLARFGNLQTLIIDENPINNLNEFPNLPSLELLSIIKVS